jgi:hypothetical protein
MELTEEQIKVIANSKKNRNNIIRKYLFNDEIFRCILN